MVCLASLIARSARCGRVSDSLARLHFASPSQPNVAPKMIVLSNVARKIIAGVAIKASLGAATAEPRGKVKTFNSHPGWTEYQPLAELQCHRPRGPRRSQRESWRPVRLRTSKDQVPEPGQEADWALAPE